VNAITAGNKWMSRLDGTLSLAQLSIPGTHDSGALFEPIPRTAKCQNRSIAEQLNTGIRFLDIRCRHVNNTFVIQHGMVNQNQTFEDVLNTVITFLHNNPSECVIMSVKEEYTASGDTRSFEDTFDSYVAKKPGIWYLASTIPRLEQVRLFSIVRSL